MTRIAHIEIDDRNLPPPTPEIEQERRVAIFDLLEENVFSLPKRDDRVVPAGPYRLDLSIREKRLVFDVSTEAGEKAVEFHLSKTCPQVRSKRSTWHAVAFTTKARVFSRNA